MSLSPPLEFVEAESTALWLDAIYEYGPTAGLGSNLVATCWLLSRRLPTQETSCRVTLVELAAGHLKPKSLADNVRSLESLGWVLRVNRTEARGRGAANATVYQLTLPTPIADKMVAGKGRSGNPFPAEHPPERVALATLSDEKGRSTEGFPVVEPQERVATPTLSGEKGCYTDPFQGEKGRSTEGFTAQKGHSSNPLSSAVGGRGVGLGFAVATEMKKTHPTPSVNESATAVAEATPEITDPRDRPLTQSELDEMFGITTTQSGTKAQSTPPTPSSTPASLAEPDSVYQHTAVESHNPHAEGAPAWDFTPDFTDEVTGNPTPPRTDPQVWMSWRWAVSQMDLTPEEMDNLVQGLQALVKRKDLLLAIHKLAHHSLAAQQDLVTELTRTASGRPQTLSERSFAGARSIATIMWNDRVKPLAAHYARIPAVAQQRENPLTPEVQGLFDSIPTIMGKGAQR